MTYYYQIAISIFILTLIFSIKNFNETQAGGSRHKDPYSRLRPMLIVDFFRRFWLTR